MSYADKLKDPRWQKKRLEIMDRDNWKCVNCGATENTLVVHHVKYDGEPWDGADADKQTLCNKCHNAMGKHPKGGLKWIIEELDGSDCHMLEITNCPLCGNNKWRDKGGYMKCSNSDCGWGMPDHIFNFGGIRYLGEEL